LRNKRLFFLVLAALLLATRLCHLRILWEGDSYPLAAAGQMLLGKALYRDIWFDKPPLLAVAYLLFGAVPGWPLRLAGALYAMLACWVAGRFARDLWSQREGLWAAALLGFFLCFDIPSAVIPLASDLLMLAPHLAAVWLAFRRRAFWSGAAAAVAFWINPKGLIVAAACGLWFPVGIPAMAAGFASVSALVAAWLAGTGALVAYWDQVWRWGRIYAASPFVDNPLGNGLARTANWAGFHAALVVAVAWFLIKGEPPLSDIRGSGQGDSSSRGATNLRERAFERLRWLAWLLLAAAGVAAGLRFFPRYYFLLLPVVAIMAARGFTLLGRCRVCVALLLLIPLMRFGPGYLDAIRERGWRDTAMDRDSSQAAEIVRRFAKPGDTLFVWGYRPELYPYTRLPAGTMYLDSQMLTGVPADRHLTQSEPVEVEDTRRRRAALAHTDPTFVVDGLGTYNPRLEIGHYPDLSLWLAHYRQVGRTAETVVYERVR
jgi:hypothetical protein